MQEENNGCVRLFHGIKATFIDLLLMNYCGRIEAINIIN